MPVARLAGLVRDGRLEGAARRLVQLKEQLKALFPGADVGRLDAAHAFLLEEDSVPWATCPSRHGRRRRRGRRAAARRPPARSLRRGTRGEGG